MRRSAGVGARYAVGVGGKFVIDGKVASVAGVGTGLGGVKVDEVGKKMKKRYHRHFLLARAPLYHLSRMRKVGGIT